LANKVLMEEIPKSVLKPHVICKDKFKSGFIKFNDGYFYCITYRSKGAKLDTHKILHKEHK